MKSDNTILVVDDSAEQISILMGCLKDDYRVIPALDGQRCLDLLTEGLSPKVIIMDVSMPLMDGYEAVRLIKKNPAWSDIDIIFLSANASDEDKLKGFELGAADYIEKPFYPAVLKRKIELCIDNQNRINELRNNHKEAFDAAMTAMVTAGELGNVLDFMRHLSCVDSVNDLGEFIVKKVSGFSVNCTVQMRSQGEIIHCSTSGQPTELEVELLTLMRGGDTIINRGSRCFFNYKEFSLLVRNMPADEDQAGRFRDHIHLMLDAAKIKYDVIDRDTNIRAMVKGAYQALDQFHAGRNEVDQNIRVILDGLMTDLNSAFLSWGLSEDQESRLVEMLECSIEKVMDQEDDAAKLEEDLKGIITSIAI